MTNQKKYPGTPAYHSMSARKGQPATHSVTRSYEIPRIKCIYPPGKCPLINGGYDRIRNDSFKTGLLLGIGAAALVFALILWLWVMPTMNAAVEAAQGMVM